MRKERTLSFVSFIATGPSPGEDKVLEVAAVRRRGEQQLNRFAQLADPGPVPLAVERLTGLNVSRVAGHPTPHDVLAKLLDFLGEAPVVVHGAQELCARLAVEDLKPPRRLLDSLALARVLLPSAGDYSLTAVARHLGLERPAMHRALDLACLTCGVWQRLWDVCLELPGQVLDALHHLAEAAGSPLSEHLAELAGEKAGFELSAEPGPALAEALTEHGELFARAQKYEAPEPGEEPLATDRIRDMFAREGAVGRNLPGYEVREEQIEMVRAVCDAFNGPYHLIFEAGPGTGKSMAYLLPAIAWACQNEDKVVVSTNTKNLQEQLYGKDLPFLERLLGGRFESAILKGRRNYLCVRQFLHLMRHFERELGSPAEIMALLPVVVWATGTETGDLAECSGLPADENARALVPRLTCGGDECAGRACPVRGRCFVRRARTLAQLADLVVVNHALLFSEVGLDQPILPVHRCLIFDEAHNLEDAATQAMTVSVDTLSVFRVTNRLWRARRDGSGSGLIATVMYEADKHLPEAGPLGKDTVRDLAQGAIESTGDVVEAARQCFETLAAPFEPVPAYEDQLLLRDCRPGVTTDGETSRAAEALSACVHKLCGRLEDMAECMELNAEHLPGGAEIAGDLRAQASRLKEVMDALEFILLQEEADYVYWLARTRREHQAFYSLHAAPLEIGRFVKGLFFDQKRCVILTSATLRVGGEFRHVRERLGADELGEERMTCAAVGSSFDFERQSLLCVPTFLPEAGGRRETIFDEELSSFLIDLLQATGGRGLVLFTSYSLLDAVHERIKRPLERAGIPVLAQARDGSREALTAMFREITGSVLLGTQSFWEGVDVPGEALSCLVLTKLPFHVVNDPLVRGRIEYLQAQGLDPFQHYTLPEAVINFRQGFGRLIRHRTDRGVVVVTDRRIVTKAYGRSFLRDLPSRHGVYREKDVLLRTVSAFLSRR